MCQSGQGNMMFEQLREKKQVVELEWERVVGSYAIPEVAKALLSVVPRCKGQIPHRFVE
jgi:hypothetical protein